MYQQILIIFGRNMPDTTGHRLTIEVPTSLNVCFYTTWENRNKRILTFLFNKVQLFDQNTVSAFCQNL